MRRVLIVAFRFPPHGGGGVHRIAAFTRYLPTYGWRPHVLTGPIGDYRSLQDPSLLSSIPEDVPVTRTGYLDTGRVYSAFGRLHLATVLRAVTPSLPSMSAGWIPPGYRGGLRVLEAERFDAIWSSSYPMSSHLVAYLLKRKTNLPWVADYRDEWSRRGMMRWPTPLHRRLAAAIDRRITRAADRVVTTSPVHTRSFARHFPADDPGKYLTITNGYDPEDFRSERGDGDAPGGLADRPEKFLLAHVGSVFAWRGADPVLAAVERVIESGRVPGDQLDVRFIGNTNELGFRHLRERGIVSSVAYVPHDAAVAWMKAADALLLINTETTNIPGKTFEYLAARRPILAAVPPGPAAEIVRGAGAGPVVDHGDVEGIAAALVRLFRDWKEGRRAYRASAESVRRYSRPETTRRLADVLDELAAGRERRRQAVTEGPMPARSAVPS